MKVLLANLPWRKSSGLHGMRAGSRFPHLVSKRHSRPYFCFPFHLAYAAAVLRRNEYEVVIRDCVTAQEPEEQFLDFLGSYKPDLVVYETGTTSLSSDWALAEATKEMLPNVKTVLCGQHVTGEPHESIRKKYVDFIFIGEYEYTLLDLVQTLESRKDPGEIRGVYSKKNGSVVYKGRRPLIHDLDALPYPVRGDLPMERYVDAFCKHTPNVRMLTSWGCPYPCTFCLEPMYDGRPNYRMRSPGSVVDEMEHLVDRFHAKEIYFNDATFSVNQERVRNLCGEIVNRGLRITWSSFADAKLELETLRAMKKAGCRALKIGVDSGAPQILKNVKRPVTHEQVRRVVKYARQVGIDTQASYVFGLPGETHETIRQTTDFAFALGTDKVQFSYIIPLPGTALFEQAEKEGWLVSRDWDEYGKGKPMIEYPGLSRDDLLHAVDHAIKRRMVQMMFRPDLILRTLKNLVYYEGVRGLASHLAQKSRYLLGRS